MPRKYFAIIATVILMAVSSLGIAWVIGPGRGNWPSSWPKELEPYRETSKTWEVASGTQEDLHMISFQSQEEFEKVWSVILTLKTKGAPLILETPDSFHSTSGATLKSGVAIVCPLRNISDPFDDRTPLADSLDLDSGDVPEYVTKEKDKWVAWSNESSKGFRYRARTDIILVVDGDVVDLNKIKIPGNTPIIDNRFNEK